MMRFWSWQRINGRKSRWYENYLPFVARRPEMQIKWLRSAFKKKDLSREEITPYVRLLLAEDNVGDPALFKKVFLDLEQEVLDQLLLAADIYDTAKLFRLLPEPTLDQALIAITKYLPLYEKKPQKLLDEIFYAVHERPGHILQWAAGSLLEKSETPTYFKENYERFLGILHDEEFLISIYPNARR